MLANARQVHVDLDASALEISRRTDTGSEEERRATVRARREDDLFSQDGFPIGGQSDADGARSLEDDPIDQNGAADLEIRASPCRGKVRQCCALPNAVEHVERYRTGSNSTRSVVVGYGGVTRGAASFEERLLHGRQV
jgi:hypothetical protein